MENLKQYPEDFSRYFKQSFQILYMANMRFLEPEKTWWEKNWKFFFIVPSLVFQSITMWIYIYCLLAQVQIYEVAYLVPPFLVFVQGVIKAAVILPNRDNITKIIKSLGDIWRVENLTLKQEKEKTDILKKLNICNTVSYCINILGTSQYLVSPLIETVIRRIILKQDVNFLLPLFSVYPFDPNCNLIVYLAVYAFQIYTLCTCVAFYTGPEMILITLSGLTGSQFTLLRGDMSRIKPVSDKEIKQQSNSETESDEMTIYDFIKRHQKLIALCQQLDNVFNPMIFSDLLFVGITTCFFRYAGQFSRGPTYMFNNYVAVFASLLQVLHLCYYGELLTSASVSVADAAFQNPWYKGGTSYRTAIWFIIKRSQIPCCLTSMRYARITLHMFTTVISTTWSYFSLMNNVYGD